MKRLGTVSYNKYCNFTNYGSVLQTWALHEAIKKIDADKYQPVLVDYCPEILANANPLMPLDNMWDKDEESQRMCELSLPSIRKNYYKISKFYQEQFITTKTKYTSSNFNDVVKEEKLDGFICGSDTIFSIDEFGFDDGFYGNYECMKNGYTVAYAASFGDSRFSEEQLKILNKRVSDFKAIGLREQLMLPYVKNHTPVPVQKVLDPTLLLTAKEYESIIAKRQEEEKYLLLYARRYNPKMSEFAEQLAIKNGWKVIEISLRAVNVIKHRMCYEAGVEEFLSLVKYAEFVVTNSYHGMIFSIQFARQFCAFSREQSDTKISELLELFGLSDRMSLEGNDINAYNIDYQIIDKIVEMEREKSLRFLKMELEKCR